MAVQEEESTLFGTLIPISNKSSSLLSDATEVSVSKWLSHFVLQFSPVRQSYLNMPTLIDRATSGFLVLFGPVFFSGASPWLGVQPEA